MSKGNDRLQRAVELMVYAPIGVGLFLRDTAPGFLQMFVGRGRAEVDRRQQDVQQRVTTVRSMGQVAVAFGVPMAREKVGERVTDLQDRVGTVRGLVGRDRDVPAAPPSVTTPPAAPSPSVTEASANGHAPSPIGVARNGRDNGQARAASELPIPGYDALSASQVVQRLAGLAPSELEAVREYEVSNRNRRTILGKIDQLTA